MAKGNDKNIKESMVKAMMCASNATGPNRPAIIVVTSKDHAFDAKLSAPGTPNFQNGFSTSKLKFSHENSGHVSSKEFFLMNIYATISRNSTSLVKDVAQGAPTSPQSAVNINPQANSAFMTLASTPIHTPGAR
mmetsp:Transcript_27718/g.52211  ORF Transcript_27718/g.52211 Transcript_27718/m.52211 type:complete len:134 (+) Transcript_27718:1035-1436(+)